jgi:hypothetical protein
MYKKNTNHPKAHTTNFVTRTCWLNLVQILKDERQNFLLVIPHKVNRVEDSLSGNPIVIHYLTNYILPGTKILPLSSKSIIIGVRIILIFTFR